ncbi:AAA family ATPase [Stappia sp. WLB 29]|uniref:AAA family ATPase n=1 Tax=Stappia sp. WLB 29 TaxID=2925220 RepID=UPI0020BFEFE5|nr:AAA family ATPase [Stappia sp. WLB 29]
MTDYAAHIAEVAKRLLGEPNKALSKDKELRFGSRGSLSVKVGGPHAGTWHDHESDNGGGVLDLVVRERGGDRKAAADWLAKEMGIGTDEPRGRSREVAAYPYHDEAGALLFEVVRFEPKDFRQRRPDGRGGYVWNLKGVSPVLYRVPELLEALANERTVFIVEGEKDADHLWRINVPATCNPGGAGKWRTDYAEIFKGADVVIIPDNDEPGRQHAETVARSLDGVAARVRVLDLVNLPRKGDVSDWLDSGASADDLFRLVETAQDWRRQAATHLPLVWFGEEDNGPSLSWLVKGLLVDGGLSTLYGPPGTSKTFLAVDMALHIAHGREWFGLKTRRTGVVYVSGEGGPGMRRRMKAWRQERDGDPTAPFAMVPQSVNLFDDDSGADLLISDILECRARSGGEIGLIVLDTLSRMIGSGDEDRARDMNVIVQRAEKIQRETGAHVLLVHHTGKDKDRGMRGSNALLGAVDAALEVARFETGLCELKIAKVKDGGDLTSFKYELSQAVLGEDADGDEITSCVIAPADARQGSEGSGRYKLGDREEIARRCLADLLADPTVTGVTGRDTGKCHGVTGGYPSHVTAVVTLDAWRDATRDRLGEDPGDKWRKQWERMKNKLLRLNVVGIQGGLAWLA